MKGQNCLIIAAGVSLTACALCAACGLFSIVAMHSIPPAETGLGETPPGARTSTGLAELIEEALRSDLADYGHGNIRGVAKFKPNVSKVTIHDISGREITVWMFNLMAYYRDEMDFDEFRNSWEVINP